MPESSRIKRRRHTYDVGSPSVYCEYGLLPLVNKEGASPYERPGYSQVERNRELTESRICHVAAKGEGCCLNVSGKPQLHGNTQINRNGLT